MNSNNHLSVSKLFYFYLFIILISTLFQVGCGGGSTQGTSSDNSANSDMPVIKAKIVLGEYSEGILSSNKVATVTENIQPISMKVPANIQSLLLKVYKIPDVTTPVFSQTQNISSATAATIEFIIDLQVGQTYNFEAIGYSLPNGLSGGGTITHTGINSGFAITATQFTVVVPLAQTATFTVAPVITNDPIVYTHNTANITGQVNPKGSETIVYFEWGTTTATTLTRTPFISIGSGINPITVTYALTGIQQNTSYRFNIIAEKSGQIVNKPNTFTTPLVVSTSISFPQPPTIASTSTSGITSTSATLNASVLPGGSETLVYFEIGTIPGSYGTMKSSIVRITGLLWTTQSVSASVSGLTTGTTYYYRVVALNSENSGLTFLIGGAFNTP